MKNSLKYYLSMLIINLPLLLANEVVASEVTPLFSRALADLPDKEGLMLTVEYGPGEVSAQHRHNAHVFVYVLEGSVVMQVEGGKAVTLHAGETFYENPQDVHTVSRNASDTDSAKILVFMLKEKDAPATLPPH